MGEAGPQQQIHLDGARLGPARLAFHWCTGRLNDKLKLELTRFGGALQALRGGFTDAQDPTAVFP